MKKFSIIFVLVMTISTISASPVFNRIRVNLQNTTTSRSDFAYLIEHPDYTPAFETGFDVMKGFLGGNIFVYSISATGQQSDYFSNTLVDLPIGFWNKTDNAATMKFTFSEIEHGLEGDFTYYLLDQNTGSMTLISAAASYTFEAAANEQNDTRFKIVLPPDFQVCAYYDNVKITGNTGTDNIVITTLANDTIVNVAPQMGVQTIDMSGKNAGHYVLTVNGTNYEFCNKPVNNK